MKALLQQKNYLILFIFLLLSNVLLAQKENNDFPSIALEISEKNMEKLRAKRDLAMYQGILDPKIDDWVAAKVMFDGKKHEAAIRLKGDLPDHWKDEKLWSFKVKLKGEATFRGMKRFALQHPARRSYMGEWYYHRLFEHLDSSFVTINYSFVNVSVNGENFPIYALEESMDTEVMERNEQRAGILLSFSPEKVIFANKNFGFSRQYLVVEPLAFRESQINKNKYLIEQYRIAQNLLEALRLGTLQTNQVFDIKKLALLFAMTDLTGSHHSVMLHNIRFFYNPITSRLEPVPYDNSNIVKVNKFLGKEAWTHTDLKTINWLPTLFEDQLFLENYIEKLFLISEKKHLDTFFETLENETNVLLKALKKDYTTYTIDHKQMLYKNQERIRQALTKHKKQRFEIYIDKNAKDANHIKVQIRNKYYLPLKISSIQIDEHILLLNDKTTIQCSDKLKPYATSSLKITKGKLNDINWNTPATIHFTLPSTTENLTEQLSLNDINTENSIYTHLVFIDDAIKKQNKQPLSEIFDFESIAQQVALYDFLGYSKTAILNDIRLEDASKNKKIRVSEPQYTLSNVRNITTKNQMYFSNYHLYNNVIETTVDANNFLDHLFLDIDFVRKYVATLIEISVLEDITDIKSQTFFIKKWQNFISQDKEIADIFTQNKIIINNTLYPSHAAIAYFENYNAKNESLDIGITNVFKLPIQIIEVTINDNIRFIPNKSNIVIFPINSYQTNMYQICNFVKKHIPREDPQDFKPTTNLPWNEYLKNNIKFTYKIVGSNKSYTNVVYPYAKYDKAFVQNDVMRKLPNANSFKFVNVDKDSQIITIEKGNFTLDENMIVPPNYKFIIEAGTTINLKQNAKIISRSPILWKGTEKAPILIKSSDGSGQGVFVMADQKESVMEYVIFDKLSNPSQHGWTLTGAVCFYESPINIEHCTFKNNTSEDALNIFRSKFTLNNSHFENTTSDALDVDFSVGTISNTTFKNCTNDAVDVSGRFITLNNLTIDKVGDKAISLGENGKMVGENIVINDSDIALVIKDLSNAEFNNVKVNNVKVGVAVYCKKPQFGPGSTVLNGFKTKNVEEKYLLETNSTLVIDNKNISPNHDDVRSIFYGSVYGKASVR